MKDQVADWLAFTTLALFCSTVFYGAAIIHSLTQ
jgi:hypothetical protein